MYKIILFSIFLSEIALIMANEFSNITMFIPNSHNSILESEPLKLTCRGKPKSPLGNDIKWFHWCKIQLSGPNSIKTCEISWGIRGKNASDCSDFLNIAKFERADGCEITLKSSSLLDGGTWNCELQSYEIQGIEIEPGPLESIYQNIEIQPKNFTIAKKNVIEDIVEMNENEDLIFRCEVNHKYEWCGFYHNEKFATGFYYDQGTWKLENNISAFPDS